MEINWGRVKSESTDENARETFEIGKIAEKTNQVFLRRDNTFWECKGQRDISREKEEEAVYQRRNLSTSPFAGIWGLKIKRGKHKGVA